MSSDTVHLISWGHWFIIKQHVLIEFFWYRDCLSDLIGMFSKGEATILLEAGVNGLNHLLRRLCKIWIIKFFIENVTLIDFIKVNCENKLRWSKFMLSSHIKNWTYRIIVDNIERVCDKVKIDFSKFLWTAKRTMTFFEKCGCIISLLDDKIICVPVLWNVAVDWNSF